MEFSNNPKIELPKKIRSSSIVIFFFVASLLMLTVSMYALFNLPKLGNVAGEGVGTVTGTALGSLQAASDAKDAVESGRDKGVSAEDTKVVIDGIAQSVGNLQVLRASVQFENTEITKNYAALSTKPGDCIFTINLLSYQYEPNNNTLYIPDVNVKIVFKEDEREDLAEYVGTGITFSGLDGMDAYINTVVQTQKEAENAIKNDAFIMDRAREEAKERVKQMVYAITGKEINVDFITKEGESNDKDKS